MIKRHLDIMKKRSIDHWRHTLQHLKKKTSTFKNNYAPSIYLDITRKNCNRKTLVKLRIGNHKLEIETGRYDNTPRCERLCSLCDMNEIEDQIHFLLRCSKYSTIRNAFYNKIVNRIPNVKQLQLTDLIFDDNIINMQFIKFVSSCFDLETNFYQVYNLFLGILISWFALAILYYYTVMQIKLVVVDSRVRHKTRKSGKSTVCTSYYTMESI